MKTTELDVVTGAFGYTGKYITRRLLSRGRRVRTLTGHPQRHDPLGGQVEVFPLNFEDPDGLKRALQGAATLYNTYWVRFPRRGATFDRAVENTGRLIKAAKEAGVHKVVHLSITNASEESPLPYFRGKGLVEKEIIRSKLSYAIIRPSVIFGLEGILINNIAWLLRRFPVFAVFGSGEYRVQPVFVEDVADMAMAWGSRDGDAIVDAVGPEVFTFNELVRLIASRIGSRARIGHVRPGLGLFLARLIGYAVRDVVITEDEVRGLMSNLLVSQSPPPGPTPLSQWLEQNADRVGVKYASEIQRHYR